MKRQQRLQMRLVEVLRRSGEFYVATSWKRLDFCELMDHCLRTPTFFRNVCFTDESTFHLNGYIDRHNCRFGVKRQAHTQRPQKLNVWAGILANEVIGPFVIDGYLDGPKYILLLHHQIIPAMQASAIRQNIPWLEIYFQQDGAPAHYAQLVRFPLRFARNAEKNCGNLCTN